MALTPEDRKELREVLEPQVNAIASQSKDIGKLAERMSTVETGVASIKETVEDQRTNYRSVTRDFARELRDHQGKIATAGTTAKAAKENAKIANAKLWGLVIALLGVAATAAVSLYLVLNGGGQ